MGGMSGGMSGGMGGGMGGGMSGGGMGGMSGGGMGGWAGGGLGGGGLGDNSESTLPLNFNGDSNLNALGSHLGGHIGNNLNLGGENRFLFDNRYTSPSIFPRDAHSPLSGNIGEMEIGDLGGLDARQDDGN